MTSSSIFSRFGKEAMIVFGYFSKLLLAALVKTPSYYCVFRKSKRTDVKDGNCLFLIIITTHFILL